MLVIYVYIVASYLLLYLILLYFPFFVDISTIYIYIYRNFLQYATEISPLWDKLKKMLYSILFYSNASNFQLVVLSLQ